MGLAKQNKLKSSDNQNSNTHFIRPSASDIAKMNRENPNQKVSNSDFNPIQTKPDAWGRTPLSQPQNTVQARLKSGQDNNIDKKNDEEASLGNSLLPTNQKTKEPSINKGNPVPASFQSNIENGANDRVEKDTEEHSDNEVSGLQTPIQHINKTNANIQRVPLAEDDVVKALEEAIKAKDKSTYFQIIRTENGTHASSNKIKSAINSHLNADELNSTEAWKATILLINGEENKWSTQQTNFIEGLQGGEFTLPAKTIPPSTIIGINAEISRISNLAATASIPSPFTEYQTEFNSMWDMAAYSGLSSDFDKSLDSTGPRTQRSRAIFIALLASKASIKTAYDQDLPSGIRSQIDQYAGPSGLNLLASPRIQALIALFTDSTSPISMGSISVNNVLDPAYVSFKTKITPAVQELNYEDRNSLTLSSEWQSLIVKTVAVNEMQKDLTQFIQSTYKSSSSLGTADAPVVGVKSGTEKELVLDKDQKKFFDHLKLQSTKPKKIISNQEQIDLDFSGKSSKKPEGMNVNSSVELSPGEKVTTGSSNLAWDPSSKKGKEHKFKVLNDSISSGGETKFTGKLKINSPNHFIPYPYEAPTKDITVVDDRLNWFNSNIRSGFTFSDQMTTEMYRAPTYKLDARGLKVIDVAGSSLEYYGGQSRITPIQAMTVPNRVPVYIEAVLTQNGVTKYPYGKRLFDKGDDFTGLGTAVVQESGTGKADNMELVIKYYDKSSSTAPFLTFPTLSFNINPGTTFTNTDVMTQAIADHKELNSSKKGGLLDTMHSNGGQAKRTAEAIDKGVITLEPLTLRADSSSYVTSEGRDPQKEMGYFAGHSDLATESVVTGPNAGGMKISTRPGQVFVNRTLSMATGATNPISEMMDFVVHESVHLLDERPTPHIPIERYKTEFRAYWMEGSASRDALSTAFKPGMSNKGPKTDKARNIFTHLYNSTTYAYVKQNYDSDSSFREEVNRYIIPDGINLIVSVRIEGLRKEVQSYDGTKFEDHKKLVNGLYGAAKPEDKIEISGNRMWKDLVERIYTVPVEQADIKKILKIK